MSQIRGRKFCIKRSISVFAKEPFKRMPYGKIVFPYTAIYIHNWMMKQKDLHSDT